MTPSRAPRALRPRTSKRSRGRPTSTGGRIVPSRRTGRTPKQLDSAGDRRSAPNGPRRAGSSPTAPSPAYRWPQRHPSRAGLRVFDALKTPREERTQNGVNWQEENYDGKAHPGEQTARTSAGEAGQKARSKAGRGPSPRRAQRSVDRQPGATQHLMACPRYSLRYPA